MAPAPRVRFAPSPTGYLHVGGARTALFNWLFARRHGGVFVLRIEDTDAERSSAEMVDGIFAGLRWLGLDWDEGPGVGGPYAPYFQSQRLEHHRAMAARLVAAGCAYYCYCTPEELKAKREAAEAQQALPLSGAAGWMYDRTCCRLMPGEVASREAARMPRVVRFKVPDGPDAHLRFDDLVHGSIAFDGANIDDFIILRSDGQPTFHLSVVSDDVEMAITHVVRGDDHISNTPKHILLYRALGAPVPAFAHVPLILGPDKKRLSKRHGATSVTEYQAHGVLPEAMVNFLALLGWSPGAGDRELFTREELVAAFTLEGISGGNAVFNSEKLDWFNQQHLLRLDAQDLVRRVQPYFEAAGLWNARFGAGGDEHDWFIGVVELLKPRAKRLGDFVEQGRFFFGGQVQYDAAAVDKHLRAAGMDEHLAALAAAFDALGSFDAASLEAALRAAADARGIKAAALIHAVRVAVTGRSASPGLFEVLALVGRAQVGARLRAAVALVARSDS